MDHSLLRIGRAILVSGPAHSILLDIFLTFPVRDPGVRGRESLSVDHLDRR